jgi:hypothetical protein
MWLDPTRSFCDSLQDAMRQGLFFFPADRAAICFLVA